MPTQAALSWGPFAGRALALAALLAAANVSAATVEEVVEVPVTIQVPHGPTADQNIVVTIFRDDSREKAKAPYLVINHGRPASPADFEKMGRVRYPAIARYLVSRGFTVLIPTRVGYGDSGGPDLENSGKCDARNFAPAFRAAAEQTLAVLAYASQLPYVDSQRGLLVGQSFGGATTIALSTLAVPGLRGAVNFAGGAGGNPTTHPGQPCSAQRLAALYQDYGHQARVPTLWLYSENDQFFGSVLPRQWFDGFVAGGGTGRFVTLPPFKNDGHPSFSGNPEAWKPEFEAFLTQLGFALGEVGEAGSRQSRAQGRGPGGNADRP